MSRTCRNMCLIHKINHRFTLYPFSVFALHVPWKRAYLKAAKRSSGYDRVEPAKRGNGDEGTPLRSHRCFVD